MFRFIVLASALCVLLLIGYIGMDKGGVNRENATETTEKTEPFSGKATEAEERARSKIDNALERSKEVVRSIFKGARTKIEEMKSPSEKESTKGEKDAVTEIAKRSEPKGSTDAGSIEKEKALQVEETGELPLFGEEKAVIAPSGKDKGFDEMAERWVVIEETQQILLNTGEILK